MGLFDKFKKDNVNSAEGGVSQKVSLEKHVVNLDKTVVDLSKKHGIDLSKQRARVVAVMDYSGSMSSRFSGSKNNPSEVQKTLTKLFPLSLRFDDDGQLDVWLFQSDFRKMEPMTKDNYDTYVEEVIKKSSYRMGGTKYAPVLEDIIGECLDGNGRSKDPVFVLFITDGDNSDKSQTTKLIKESSKMNIFIQFIGIGGDSFDYLEKLDDLSDRACDNTGFEKFRSLADTDDNEAYTKLLEQYTQWLKVKPV